MKAALYARYSSENQKESSIIDQFRNCEQRATREGWTIVERYKDEAISGSITERPGYQQMLKDAKARQFDILLVDSFSRLSRDSMESEQTRRRFVHWGCRLIGVSDGVDTAIEGHEIQAGVQGIMNQRFLKDLAKKYEDYGVEALVYTDIGRDGMMTGVNIEATLKLAQAIRIPIIASGGLNSVDDVKAVCKLAPEGVVGAIAGRALYEGKLDFKAAMKAAKGT